MANPNSVFIGTELKLNVSIDPINNITMDDYDFDIEVYCSNSKVLKISKKDAIKVDSSNYLICVDTSKIGNGNMKIKVTAFIPDDDFEDNLRTEVQCIDTGIYIRKCL